MGEPVRIVAGSALLTFENSKASNHCFESRERLRNELRLSKIGDEKGLVHLFDEC